MGGGGGDAINFKFKCEYLVKFFAKPLHLKSTIRPRLLVKSAIPLADIAVEARFVLC